MSKKLVEKKNDLILEATQILDTAKVQERALTEEEAAKVEEINKEVESIKRTMALEEQVRANEIKAVSKEEEKTEERSVEEVEAEQFENFVRGYTVHARSGELSPASGSGQAVIPKTIARRIIRKVYDICPILERSDRYNVKGTLELPFYDETADHDQITVAYASEFSDLTSHSGAFDTVSLGGFLAGALTKISRSLINNVEFDIVGFIVDEMALAIRRFIEHECLIGTTSPSAKILGLSNLTNYITAASASAITADEVIKLHDRVKDAYQRDAIWIMNPTTRTALRLLKDNMGRYLLQDDISSPFGSTLLGKPVYASDNMPTIATGVNAIFYGDMKGLATKFSEDMNIEILRELYAAQHAVGVVGWLEFDAKVRNAQMIAALKMA